MDNKAHIIDNLIIEEDLWVNGLSSSSIIDLNGNRIVNVGTASGPNDAITYNQMITYVSGATGSLNDQFVRVSSTDTTTGYLSDKINAGKCISLTYSNTGDQSITINNDRYMFYAQDEPNRTSTSTTYVNITTLTLTGLVIGRTYIVDYGVEATTNNNGQKAFSRIYLGVNGLELMENIHYSNIANLFTCANGFYQFTATTTTQIIQLQGRVSGSTGTWRRFRIKCIEK